ncbi:MAG TPA: alpha-hydroxy acid oxidase [Kofleriaceae bacterium]|jgi:4-hydroxymandelate oxidase|nr:alpha-hydroxy acid oxidase [Kofleriaceae bacterium]
MTDALETLSIADLERLAEARLTPMAWAYYASGADDERTLARNEAAWRERALHYRVLVDVAQRDLATTALGSRIAMPVIVAPTAFHRLACGDGELATVAAAGDAGTIFTLSTLSNTRVEEVVAAASGPVWFQLYVYKDRGATEALVRRVEAAGAKALVLTVDAPLLGRRERDVKNRFALPPELGCVNLTAEGYANVGGQIAESGLAAYFASLLDPSLNWRDVSWLRSITTLPIVVKGLVRADDAQRAIDHGAAAIVVSNHGGRQLDTSPATAEVLAPIADVVADRAELFVDGGIRRGTDVVKALALGARAVLVGRPILWGLAAAGRDGVAAALAILRRELDLAMALCGAPAIAAITRDLVAPSAPASPR